MATDRPNSADMLDEALAALKKSQQKVNRELSRAARTRRRVSQRAGSVILEIPAAIRARVLRILDTIVEDEKKLEACERLLKLRTDLRALPGSSPEEVDPGLAAAE